MTADGAGDAAAGPAPGAVQVLEQLASPCFLVDRKGQVAYQNPASVPLFGATAANLPLSFVIRAPELSEAVQAAIRDGATQTVTYFERVPTERWFEARVSPLADSDGAGAAFHLVVLRDLTDAQLVERMRVDFIASVSHELRTPLASLLGFIETLQGPARADPAARDRFLGVMLEQARRMSRLVDDLISLSRIELKAHVRPNAIVDLKPILEHVAEAMMPLAHKNGIEVNVTLPEHPLTVRGDHDELAQLFQNLLHNAIKYGHEGGRVDLLAGRTEDTGDGPDRITVKVRDYGPGIPEEHLPRLTERFYRVNAQESREKGGTGLGLAIVKHILNRHGGQLVVDSAAGEGATFTVHLAAETGRTALPESFA